MPEPVPALSRRSLIVTTTATLAVLASALPAAAASGASTAGAAGAGPRARQRGASEPFVSGTEGYDTFRIPAVLTTPSGTVLAFAEGRVGGSSDTGDIDVVVKRSRDGGRTWGPLILVATGDGNVRGNPAPVIDPATGRLVLLTCYNAGDATEAEITAGQVSAEDSRRVFVQFSEDDGRTFSEPREITADVKLPEWRWYATGPCHAIALIRGPHAGRLVVPANHSTSPPPDSTDTGGEHKYLGAHCLLSDNGGEDWRIGFVDDSYEGVLNGNESVAAELPDGRVYFNTRDHNGISAGARADAFSSDGGETLDAPYAMQPSLNDAPVVQCSALQLEGRNGPLLFSGPSVPTARRALALWRSDDDGASFRKVETLSEDPAAYSDLVQLDRRTLGVLYETGAEGPYEKIEFRRIPISELRD